MDHFQESHELAMYIKNQPKLTPVKAYIKGHLPEEALRAFRHFSEGTLHILFGELQDVRQLITTYYDAIEDYILELDRKNSAIPLLSLEEVEARVEPGAIIRDRVTIEKGAVIMMGAVINIGAHIGSGTMVDMNAVVGSRAKIGSNVHIGAGAVIAGVLEPPGKQPVIIEDGAFIGANAVILEGIRVGERAVVAAGAVVTKDVPPHQVVAGVPARIIKSRQALDTEKTKIVEELRG